MIKIVFKTGLFGNEMQQGEKSIICWWFVVGGLSLQYVMCRPHEL